MNNQTNRAQWQQMSFEERARLVVGNLDLTDKQYDAVMKEWSEKEYEDSYDARTEALADLQAIALAATLSPKQRSAEQDRITALVRKVMDK